MKESNAFRLCFALYLSQLRVFYIFIPLMMVVV